MSTAKAAAVERLRKKGIAPRGLSQAEAAAYVGLCPSAFVAGVSVGTYPKPISRGAARPVYDRRALDAAMDRLSGITTDSEDPGDERDAIERALDDHERQAAS